MNTAGRLLDTMTRLAALCLTCCLSLLLTVRLWPGYDTAQARHVLEVHLVTLTVLAMWSATEITLLLPLYRDEHRKGDL